MGEDGEGKKLDLALPKTPWDDRIGGARMGSRKRGVALTCPLWVQGLSQEVPPTVVGGASVGEGIFAAGLSGAGGPVGQLRRAEGRLGLGVRRSTGSWGIG